MNKVSGKIAFLTNIREPYAGYEMSRGFLVPYFLQHSISSSGSVDVKQEIDELTSSDPKLAGFNLLLFTLSGSEALSYDATFLTNGGGGNPITSRSTTLAERRCGALSNGIDCQGGNEWPKVQHGIAGLNDILSRDTGLDDMTLAEGLFGLLSRRTSPSPPRTGFELRNTVHVDPLMMSLRSAADDGPTDVFGTCLSTVVLVRRDGEVIFLERDMWTLDRDSRVPVLAESSSQRTYKFRLNVNVS